jgi:acyl carrier protein
MTLAVESLVADLIGELLEEEGLPLPELAAETVLLDTGLDSLGFAVLVTRLEESLGYDPFSLMTEPVYPVTFSEFVEVYQRYAPSTGREQ